jgi:hypothetical protein
MPIPTSARTALLLGAGILGIALSARALLAGAGPVPNAPEGPAARAPLPVAKSTRVRGAALRVELEPPKQAIQIGTTQEWSVRIASADGAPLGGCKVRFDGTMPEHGHGLPTAPRATGESSKGRYRIEGVRFSMAGYWQLDVEASCDEGAQHTRFDLRL